MNLHKFPLFILSLIIQVLNVVSIEPLTIFGVSALFGGSAVVYKTFDLIKDNTYCKFNECCNNDYITNDTNKLNDLLHSKVYGQHIVIETVVPALKAHFEYQSRKPLVLSFHGWPGSGKNYVSQFIIESLYKKGIDSKYVHMFSGGLHFPVPRKKEIYMTDLANKVKSAVRKCKRSLFVFDEVDKMPPGVLDAIKPMLDFNANIDGVDYRNAIFIFLSNKGGEEISKHLINIWSDGLRREDTKLYHFERLIIEGTFNEDGGFKHAEPIKSGLIDHYVPFFPLEQRHVVRCARDEFAKKGENSPSDAQLEEVLSYMTYGPLPHKLFSNSGCKRVSQKVATIITKERMQKNRD